ncbi:MAG: T9SS type A sorting domain-containing protein [Saprospiraceae bacterium]|nr:T9SS type A sorting domain-containing protein [Saprospiraceae bacterium]
MKNSPMSFRGYYQRYTPIILIFLILMMASSLEAQKFQLENLSQERTIEKEIPTFFSKKASKSSKVLDDLFYDYEGIDLPVLPLFQKNSYPAEGKVLSFNLELPEKGLINFTIYPSGILAEDFQFSVLTPNGKVRENLNNGIFYKGIVNGDPNQKTRITLTEEIFFAWFQLGNEEYFIEPLSFIDANSKSTSYAFYSRSSVKPTPHLSCGNTDLEEAVSKISGTGGGEKSEGTCFETEVALAAAYDMVEKYGTPEMVAIKLASITNIVQALFDNGALGVKYKVTEIVVPSSLSGDPWFKGICMDDLLPSFINWGPTGFESHDIGQLWVARDVAKSFGGSCTNSGLIGRSAGLGTVCGPGKYNCCEDWSSTNAAAQAHLSAHEIGHAWNAKHSLAEENSQIMWPYLTASSPNASWSASNQMAISIHRDSRDCLRNCSCDFNIDCSIFPVIEVDCREEVPPPGIPNGLIESDCHTPSYYALSFFPTLCSNNDWEGLRTYIITDSHGTSFECQQRILIKGNKGPEVVEEPGALDLDLISDKEYECPDFTGTLAWFSESPWEPCRVELVVDGELLGMIDGPTSIDDCGLNEMDASFLFDVVSPCQNSLELRWRIVDECGSESYFDQKINFLTQSPPGVSQSFEKGRASALGVNKSGRIKNREYVQHPIEKGGTAHRGVQLKQRAGEDNIAKQNIAFSIFPNPSKRSVSLRFSEAGTVISTIQIHHLDGRIVKAFDVEEIQNNGSIEIDIQDLMPGIYALSAIDKENKTYTQKLIKI